MDDPPSSLGVKLTLAIPFWLFVCFISIPLWDLADMLFQAYRHESHLSALVDLLLHPGGTLFGLILMFGITAEHGLGSIAERYWPAVLIASAFTAWLLRHWWRRS
jgi:hypothetical protein